MQGLSGEEKQEAVSDRVYKFRYLWKADGRCADLVSWLGRYLPTLPSKSTSLCNLRTW
jgi:hypothetical protein